LKKLNTVLEEEKEFIKILHRLLDIKEKSVYVNECEVPVVKADELVSKKVAPEFKTPEHVVTRHVQAKRVAKKTLSFNNQVTGDVQIKKEHVGKTTENTMSLKLLM